MISTMHEEALRAFPFLSTLPQKSRETLLSKSVRKSLAHKELLVAGGTECVYLPFVLEGTLRIYKASESGRELTLYRIERGESCILTATCILNGGSFPAIAEAEGSTEVLLVPATLMVDLVEESAPWRRFVFGLYSKRLDNVMTLVEEVAFHHVDTRIAAKLAKLATGRARTVTRTHAELAAELGTSREVVTRILADLEADGLIEIQRGRIKILLPEALAARAAIDSVV
jgi:CRP/FNR family transcriptional regulator, anaerobic regulatory protein